MAPVRHRACLAAALVALSLAGRTLAQEILSGRFGPGDIVRVDAVDGRLVFERIVEAELVE